MLARGTSHIVACLFLLLVLAAPAVQSAPRSAADDMASIAGWVRKAGVAAVVKANLAAALKLNQGMDIPSTAVSFTSPSMEGRSDIVMARFDPGFRVFWLVKNGEIQETLFVNSASSQLVDNEPHRPAWVSVKEFFLGKALASPNGAGSVADQPNSQAVRIRRRSSQAPGCQAGFCAIASVSMPTVSRMTVSLSKPALFRTK